MLVDMAKLLTAHGADLNRVARGHSPLSLAIVNGHNQVCGERERERERERNKHNVHVLTYY